MSIPTIENHTQIFNRRIGVIAFGKTLAECAEELHSTLEDWVLMGLKKDHDLPIIKSINLNREIICEPLETV